MVGPSIGKLKIHLFYKFMSYNIFADFHRNIFQAGIVNFIFSISRRTQCGRYNLAALFQHTSIILASTSGMPSESHKSNFARGRDTKAGI